MAKVVLITGCSTGIGQDLAKRLSQVGYQVVATARNVESLEDLPVSDEVILHLGDSVWDMALRRMFRVNPANTN